MPEAAVASRGNHARRDQGRDHPRAATGFGVTITLLTSFPVRRSGRMTVVMRSGGGGFRIQGAGGPQRHGDQPRGTREIKT